MKIIKLTQGYTTKVDDEDYDRLSKHKWFINKRNPNLFYAIAFIYHNGKQTGVKMHRMILNLKKDDGIMVDHKDKDGLNNQKENLRTCSHAQNNQNKNKYKGASKYKGVTPYISKRWQAKIVVDRKVLHLGFFENEIDAARAYDIAAEKYFGEFANLNFKD